MGFPDDLSNAVFLYTPTAHSREVLSAEPLLESRTLVEDCGKSQTKTLNEAIDLQCFGNVTGNLDAQ
jgi:hypothetical protein